MSLFHPDPIAELLEKLYLPQWNAVEWTFPAHWGLQVPDDVVSMYVFTQGGGWFVPDAPGAEPIRVRAGDHLITTRGTAHRMLHSLDCAAEPVAERMSDPTWHVPAGTESTAMLYAQFSLRELKQNPLSIGLPEIVHLNHRAESELRSCVPLLDLLSGVKREAEYGWQLTVRKLAELIFIKTLSVELTHGSNDNRGTNHLKHAVTDATVGPVLKELVQSLGAPWTVPKMAKMANVSKSAFSERFRNLVGTPPLQYLTEIRMQNACELLRESPIEIANIATLVGYESPSSFSNAFKRWYGKSPAEYRRGASENKNG
ncbi:AraC family transcriptional regulator [Aporhodopirellula aestuarii]|uniref:AraC family transcriptional regulator n=1 Tax=Aporhodopirellula aestuarii TaxID=2950107 RepID=A0ABT0TZD4_9BACT|nr:AraC family transcriptional regulator [Aporhodopirellula aestuarii]MCM2369958.1 AraC family transcriptional regulator [Aporhodopirellula aestuarii]